MLSIVANVFYVLIAIAMIVLILLQRGAGAAAGSGFGGGASATVFGARGSANFLSRSTVVPALGVGMAPWREKLFANMHRNAASVVDFLNLPPNRVVELGTKVQI